MTRRSIPAFSLTPGLVSILVMRAAFGASPATPVRLTDEEQRTWLVQSVASLSGSVEACWQVDAQGGREYKADFYLPGRTGTWDPRWGQLQTGYITKTLQVELDACMLYVTSLRDGVPYVTERVRLADLVGAPMFADTVSDCAPRAEDACRAIELSPGAGASHQGDSQAQQDWYKARHEVLGKCAPSIGGGNYCQFEGIYGDVDDWAPNLHIDAVKDSVWVMYWEASKLPNYPSRTGSEFVFPVRDADSARAAWRAISSVSASCKSKTP